jgi:hypothetical protein
MLNHYTTPPLQFPIILRIAHLSNRRHRGIAQQFRALGDGLWLKMYRERRLGGSGLG